MIRSSANPLTQTSKDTIFSDRNHLILWLSLILIVGFLTTSILSYFVSLKVIRSSITDQALPLTGDNVYSEIQKDIVKPIFISSQMASNTFLRDWLINGEENQEQVVRYLREVKQEHHSITAFLISEKTRKYYYADGLLEVVSEQDPKDTWFFRVRQMTEDYETNVDPDAANRGTMTVFINHRVQDYEGNFIGVTGVGLTLENVRNIIEASEQRFNRRIYFVDKEGNIVLTSTSFPSTAQTLQTMPGVQRIADQILAGSTDPLRLNYPVPSRWGHSMQVNSRYIPELNWYLVVEQSDGDATKPVRTVLFVNLAISTLATLLVLCLTLPTIRRYQRRLERTASTDPLTGLINRQAFDFLFAAHLKDANRRNSAFSALIFDIDYFKHINDQYGHLAGDSVIQQTAEITRNSVRNNDIVARWGGEEFMVLLKDCHLEQAQQIAEKIRHNIERHDFCLGKPKTITVSLGVSIFKMNESTHSFFTRTDQALYRAKQHGRNRLEIAV
jgi:diguanylate cyclase (GGDEF)-like protein